MALLIRLATRLSCTILALAWPSATSALDLPARAPRPAPSPLAPADIAPLPLPSPRLQADASPSTSRPPLPSPRPSSGPVPKEQSAPADPYQSHEARRAAPPGPTDELSCRARLRTLGVDFSDRAPIDQAPGCIVAHPLAVKSLGQSIDIAPEAVLNCATAEATARFLADVVVPAAKSVFGESLVAISDGSTFVCRPRNGTTKLSEHAFGNAIDIGAFKLASGRIINVSAATDPKEADFLARVRMAACGPFKTVLGPGTDADHAQHFHFDLAKRRNGGTYCR